MRRIIPHPFWGRSAPALPSGHSAWRRTRPALHAPKTHQPRRALTYPTALATVALASRLKPTVLLHLNPNRYLSKDGGKLNSSAEEIDIFSASDFLLAERFYP